MQSKINALEIKEKSTPPGVRSEKQILKQTFSREVGKCPICGGEARYFDKAVMLKKYDVTYYRCSRCESIFTEDPYWLDEAYDEAITPVDVGLVQRNVDLFPIFRNIIEGMYPKAEKFLDFAGGRGLWVRMMRDNGYDFRWFDKYAEDMFNPPFVDIAKIEGKYDVVTALEVFEHLICPKEDLKGLLEHTENLIFTTQTVPPNLQRVEDWWYFAPLEGQHIMFYTQKALNKLAADFNMCYIGTPLIHIFSKEPISKETFEACLTGNISIAKRTSLVESDFERAYAIYNAV